MTEKFTVYSSLASQWANVPKLGLAEKEYPKDSYEVKEIDILVADNFDPAYLAINPNGTVPSLTSASLPEPLVDSRTVLQHIDASHPSGPSLAPADAAARARMDAIIDLIHKPELSTNLILLQARSADELRAKRADLWGPFVAARQARLETEGAALPDHAFYGPKAAENGALAALYAGDAVGEAHARFFEQTHGMYRDLARGLEALDGLLVLPYAAGERVSEADLHVAPWFAHAMWGAGTDPADVKNFGPLEDVVRVSVPGFKVGDNIKAWWGNFVERPSFKEVFPRLH